MWRKQWENHFAIFPINTWQFPVNKEKNCGKSMIAYNLKAHDRNIFFFY